MSNPAVLVALLLVSAAAVGRADYRNPVTCPHGFERALGKVCVRRGTDRLPGTDRLRETTFQEAKEICSGLGGYLWEPKCMDEQRAGIKVTDVWDPWLGINDHASAGNYVYDTTGQPIQFSNWQGAPDSGASTDCAYVKGENTSQNWHPTPCTYRRPIICQADPVVGGCFERNVLYEESEGFAVQSDGECHAMCQQTDACHYYEFDAIDQRCWIRATHYKDLIVRPTTHFWGTALISNQACGQPVGFAIPLDDPQSCQDSCQTDNRCRSFTWLAESAPFHQRLCLHNYGRTRFRRTFPGQNGTAYISGPKYCNYFDGDRGICSVEYGTYSA